MVEVDHQDSSVLDRIGEHEYSGMHRGGHFGLYSTVQGDSVVSRMGLLLAVVELGVLRLAVHSGKEEKVSEVRDSGTAQVGEAEALHVRFGILVSGGAVIVLVVAVRTDLYGSVRELRSRIYIPKPVSPHEHVHIIYQPLRPVVSWASSLPGSIASENR